MKQEKADLLHTAFKLIADGNIIICPSWGEYPVYDELAYDVMCNDQIKMRAYGNAIRQSVKDKVVVEIGTGSRAPLALLCAEAGAKLVYAIEADLDAAMQASQLVRAMKLEHKIKVIHGYSTTVQLSECVDLCVSEIIGNIGSSEGAISIINSARHFLKDDGHLIPERCVTQIAPTILPDNLYENELAEEVMQDYVNQMYQAVGHEFPITRYAVYNFPKSNIIASPEIFEDIYFNHNPETHMTKTVEFNIPNDSPFDGFLLWINLHVDENNIIDSLEGTLSWAPVYLKAEKMDLKKDDVLKVNCMRKLSPNQINPDYFFDGTVFRDGQAIQSFRLESYYSKA